jgi:protein involved in polysaccharide export with SLBB domain
LISSDIVVAKKSAVRVWVTGQVRSPGCYDLKMGCTVLDALAVAGGILAPIEDCASIKVSKLSAAGGGRLADDRVNLDLSAILANDRLSNGDLILHDGDILVVRVEQTTYDPLAVVQGHESQGGLIAQSAAGKTADDRVASMTTFFLASILLLIRFHR